MWIEAPQGSLESLLEAIRSQLGLADEANRPVLSVYMQTVDVLLVVDEAQTILDNPRLLSDLAAMMGAARLILCAAQLPDEVFDMSCLRLSPLGKEAAFKLLEYWARTRNLSHCENHVDRFDALFSAVGGNPGALRRAFFPKQSLLPIVLN